MKLSYTAAITFLLCSLCLSCAFDSDNPPLYKLEGDYYVSVDTNASNRNGLEIVYTKDREFLQNIASNCLVIYSNKNEIAFSSNFFAGDTLNVEYYTTDVNSRGEKKQVDSVFFKTRISNIVMFHN
jgi:lipopolysaccharide export system protein LptA